MVPQNKFDGMRIQLILAGKILNLVLVHIAPEKGP